MNGSILGTFILFAHAPHLQFAVSMSRCTYGKNDNEKTQQCNTFYQKSVQRGEESKFYNEVK